MKHFTSIIFFIIIFGCQNNSDNKLTFKTEKKYGTETKYFGDSLKIIYQYKGDTIIQNRIDLKGASDDGWDDSFIVTSIWSNRMASKLNCSEILELKNNNLSFKFCTDSVIKKIDNDLNKYAEEPWRLKGLEKLRDDLEQIRESENSKFSKNMFNLSFDWLREIDYYGFDYKTESEIVLVLLEKYETNFSGGTNFYLVNKKNDTIANFHFNEWMR